MPKAHVKNRPMDLDELKKIELRKDGKGAERFDEILRQVIHDQRPETPTESEKERVKKPK